jgi:hypothetical protein
VAKAAKQDTGIAMDRRGKKTERRSNDRREKEVPVAVERRQVERREKVARRRQIDPTTCEREYSDEEIAFMQAMDAYKRKNGRMFPTCSEILEVIRDLGYVKIPAATTPVEAVAAPAANSENTTIVS